MMEIMEGKKEKLKENKEVTDEMKNNRIDLTVNMTLNFQTLTIKTKNLLKQ